MELQKRSDRLARLETLLARVQAVRAKRSQGGAVRHTPIATDDVAAPARSADEFKELAPFGKTEIVDETPRRWKVAAILLLASLAVLAALYLFSGR